MGVILGIDIGGSTTKIVGYREDGTMISRLQVRAADQITSLYGAFGHFISENHIPMEDIEKIAVTGVGSSMLSGAIYDIPTVHVDEFKAIGYGGLHLSGKSEAVVVSMGTGTAYVRASHDRITHIGGSGVGGGTLLGLCEELIHERHFEMITKIAEQGDLSNVDLMVKDIAKNAIPTLPPETTASNFGKITNTASKADLALGLINMVLQTIGVLAVFACKNDDIRDVVLTGALTELPQVSGMVETFSSMYGLRFSVPDDAVYATAIGAALPFVEAKK